MRILSISDSIWSMGDGKGTPSLFNVQKGFVEAGHEVHLVIPDENGDGEERFEGMCIHKFWLPFRPFHPGKIVLHRLTNKLYWISSLLFGAKRSLQLARQIAPDIVYGHTSFGAPIAYMVSKKFNIPNVTRLYGTFLYPVLRNPVGLVKKIEEVLAFKIPCAAMIITDDGTRGREVAETLGVSSDKIQFWMNGVRKDIYRPAFDKRSFKRALGIQEDKKIILLVSRLARWKHVERMVSAVPKIVSEYSNVVVVIVGEGEEKANLINQSRRLKLGEYIKFMGAVPYDDVGDFLNASEIFVTLNDISNVSNALLEAMRCGKCVVALNTGNTGNILTDGENGVLLDPDQIGALPSVILRLLKDDVLRQRLGEAAFAYAQQHFLSWEERVRMEINFAEDLVKSWQRQPRKMSAKR